MTLAVFGSPLTGGSNVVGIDNIPGQNKLVYVWTTSPHTQVAQIDIATGVLSGQFQINNVAAGQGVKMISATRGMITGVSGVNWVFDISTSTSFNLLTNNVGSAGGVFAFQNLAAANGFGFYGGNLGHFGKIDPVALTNVDVLPYWTGSQGDQPMAIIPRTGTNNLICSTYRGRIIEFDTDGNVIFQYNIKQPTMWLPNNGGFTNFSPGVSVFAGFMSFYAGYLLCSTNFGQLILFDHDQGIELQRVSWPANNAAGINSITPICSSTNQTVLMAGADDVSNFGAPLVEVDFLQTPMTQRGFMYGEPSHLSTGGYQTFGINPTSGIAWAYFSETGVLSFFTISGQRTLSTLPISQTISGVGQSAQALILNDGGAGTMQMQFATSIPPAGRSVPVTSGKNALIALRNGTGVNDKLVAARINPT